MSVTTPLPQAPRIAFDNTYSALPERFFARQAPTPMPAPGMIKLNTGLAGYLGLDARAFDGEAGAALLAGTCLPAGADPISMVYAGHQFGGWAGRLGDGRAVLLGEVVAGDGERFDLHLKGAGRTPFSRTGDGRAVLGPVLREYVVSEGMHALGIPTSRALAALSTGEVVMRERPFPGAMLVRVARSHVRVGTFEHFRAAGDDEGLRLLADYVIERHYRDVGDRDAPYAALLAAVVRVQAELVARWMQVGFIHGVMNTDNTQLAGETIDYGPCAFMDRYDPATVFSSIDYLGRYAYSNQPRAAHWNLASFARTLLPLLDHDPQRAVQTAQAAVDEFPRLYEAAWLRGLRAKLGLAEPAGEDADVNRADRELVQAFLDALHAGGADFTLAFRSLSFLPEASGPADDRLRAQFDDPTVVDDWLVRWRRRLAAEDRPHAGRQAVMRAANPVYIPRNHRVEAVIAAGLAGDFDPLHEMVAVLSRPYEDQPGKEHLARPPEPHEVVARTFCGT